MARFGSSPCLIERDFLVPGVAQPFIDLALGGAARRLPKAAQLIFTSDSAAVRRNRRIRNRSAEGGVELHERIVALVELGGRRSPPRSAGVLQSREECGAARPESAEMEARSAK